MTPDLPPGCTLDDQERAWGEVVDQDDDPWQIDEPEEETPMTATWTDMHGQTFTVEGDADGIRRIIGGTDRVEQRFADFSDSEIAEMRLALPARPPSLDSPSWRVEVQSLVDGIRAGRLAVDDLRAWAAAGSLAAVEALARIGAAS